MGTGMGMGTQCRALVVTLLNSTLYIRVLLTKVRSAMSQIDTFMSTMTVLKYVTWMDWSNVLP